MLTSTRERTNQKTKRNSNKTSKLEIDTNKEQHPEPSMNIHLNKVESRVDNKNMGNIFKESLDNSLNILEENKYTKNTLEPNEEESLEKEKHIEFLDYVTSKTDTKPSDTNFSKGPRNILSQSGSETKYYLNYEGRLSIKRVKIDTGTLLSMSSENEYNEKTEFVISILNEILFTLPDKCQSVILKKPSSHISSKAFRSKYVNIKDRIERERETTMAETVSVEHKIKTSGSERIPVISSVVRHLGLPIDTSSEKPYVGVKATYDKVMTGKDTGEEVISSERKEMKKGKDSDETEEFKSCTLEDEEHLQISPFDLKWCFGFNPEIPVLNLSTSYKSLIVFASSQFSVLYDFQEETMTFMQGHMNDVSCIACDLTGSYLVSADVGYNNQVLIWDSRPCLVKVVRNLHPSGAQLVALSWNGELLVTISPLPKQNVQVWLWQQDATKPAAERVFNEMLGKIKKVTINPTCAEEFALTFETGVKFVYFEKGKSADLKSELHFDTHLTPPKLGACTATTFLSEQYAAALSSTSKGYVILWVKESEHKKIHEKHVHLDKGCITHITAVDNVVAITSESGEVSFYNSSLLILYWTNKLKGLGPLVSFSFNISEDEGTVLCERESQNSCAFGWRNDNKRLTDASIKPEPFSCRDIVISECSPEYHFIIRKLM